MSDKNEKLITFTLDKGQGEQDLIDTNMQSIASELEAEAVDYFKRREQDEEDEDYYEVTIRIEKTMTREEVENLPDYTG